jgi:hypothetical protein
MNFFSTIQHWSSDLFHTRSLKRRKIGIFIFGMLIFVGVLAYTPHAFADPPSSPYTPGETLTPSCSPGALNCTVTPPLGATTTLTTGSLLFVGNASGTVYENNPNLFWDNINARLGIGTGVHVFSRVLLPARRAVHVTPTLRKAT